MKKLLIGMLMFLSGVIGAAELPEDDPVAIFQQFVDDVQLAQALQRVEDEDKGDANYYDDPERATALSDMAAGIAASCAEKECTVVPPRAFQRRTMGQETLAELFARKRGKAGFIQTDFDRIVSVLLNIISSAEETMKCLVCHDGLQKDLAHKIGITSCCNQCICSSCSKVQSVQERCPQHCAQEKNYGIFRYDSVQHKLFLTTYEPVKYVAPELKKYRCCVVQ